MSIITNNLPELAASIRQEHHLAEQHAMQAVNHAMEAGRLLIEAKALCSHGKWLSWLADNFEGSARTAQAYMRLYEKRDALANTQSSAHLSIDGALKLLAEPKEAEPVSGAEPPPYKPPSRDAIDQWPDLIDAPSRVFSADGMSHQQIADMLGVDVDMVRRRLDPEPPARESHDWADANMARWFTKRVQTYINMHHANAYRNAAGLASKIKPKKVEAFLVLERHYNEKGKSEPPPFFCALPLVFSKKKDKEEAFILGLQLELAAHHDYLEAVGMCEPAATSNIVFNGLAALSSEAAKEILESLGYDDHDGVPATAAGVKLPEPEALRIIINAKQVAEHVAMRRTT